MFSWGSRDPILVADQKAWQRGAAIVAMASRLGTRAIGAPWIRWNQWICSKYFSMHQLPTRFARMLSQDLLLDAVSRGDSPIGVASIRLGGHLFFRFASVRHDGGATISSAAVQSVSVTMRLQIDECMILYSMPLFSDRSVDGTDINPITITLFAVMPRHYRADRHRGQCVPHQTARQTPSLHRIDGTCRTQWDRTQHWCF